MEKEDYELRIEAKVKVSTAPRRVNLHVNTQIVQSDAAVISSKYVEENFNDWNDFSVGNEVGCLTLSSDQLIIFKWDFSQFNECKTEENGLLEISVGSYQTGKFSLEELGQIRLVEIIGGNEYWNRETVTYKNFMGINNPKEVLNMQPVYDLDLKSQSGNKKYFTVSK